jgi:hypothetical protein
MNRIQPVKLLALTLLLTVIAAAQQKSPSPQYIEFPAVMREKIAAGSTPVGTKVEAQLLAATLVNGTVVPRNAILSGEVIESTPKSATEPSLLSIRLNSAQWKKGSTPIKAYLTAWYYPVANGTNQDLSYEPADVANSPRNWNGAGTYPDPNNPASRPFPGADSGKDSSNSPSSPASNIAKHRVAMKNIESSTNADGNVILSSGKNNIKLDKITTYVFSNSDLLPRN